MSLLGFKSTHGIEKTELFRAAGKVTQSRGLIFEAHLPNAAVGSLARILPAGAGLRDFERAAMAEVIGFRNKRAMLMAFDDLAGLNSGSLVVLEEEAPTVGVGSQLLGRALDGRGSPIDGGPPLSVGLERRGIYQRPSDPLKRTMIHEPLDLGIRAINAMLTCGKGQRVGIMAGSGVGKSILLGMMARNTSADVNVIALIGERGREVREFIERDLGTEGLKRSIVIVATSDQSPLLRMRAAFLACTVAEYFRDRGKDVLFMMDS